MGGWVPELQLAWTAWALAQASSPHSVPQGMSFSARQSPQNSGCPGRLAGPGAFLSSFLLPSIFLSLLLSISPLPSLLSLFPYSLHHPSPHEGPCRSSPPTSASHLQRQTETHTNGFLGCGFHSNSASPASVILSPDQVAVETLTSLKSDLWDCFSS